MWPTSFSIRCIVVLPGKGSTCSLFEMERILSAPQCLWVTRTLSTFSLILFALFKGLWLSLVALLLLLACTFWAICPPPFDWHGTPDTTQPWSHLAEWLFGWILWSFDCYFWCSMAWYLLCHFFSISVTYISVLCVTYVVLLYLNYNHIPFMKLNTSV